jgi:phage/plasmid-like protein (TIGR03299 family)
MVSAKGIVAWHKLGVVAPGTLTANEAFTLGGLDWEVGLREVYNQQGQIIPGAYSITRIDTNAHLGFVTQRYNPFQNRGLFDIVQAMEDEDARFETAGVLKGGTQVWSLAELNRDLYIAGDQFKPFFLVTNNHDGKGGVVLKNVITRVVCANTLAMAMGEAQRSFSLRHVGDFDIRISEAKKALGFVRKYVESFEEFANRLVEKHISKAQTDALIEHLIPMSEEATKKGITVVQNAREALQVALNADDLDNIRGTAWGIVQGVTDYETHVRRINGAEKDERAALERAFTRTVDDSTMRDQALKYLLAVA